MTCPKCGSFVSDNLTACPFCNTAVNNEEAKTVQYATVDSLNNNNSSYDDVEDIYSSSEDEKINRDDAAPKSNFDPSSYPVIDPTELPAYKTAQKAAQAEKDKQHGQNNNASDFINMEYDSVDENDFVDDGPEIIGLTQASSKTVKNDKSTFSVGGFIKNAFGKVSGFIKKLFSKKNDQPKSEKKSRIKSFKPTKKMITLICIITAVFIVAIVSIIGIVNMVNKNNKEAKYDELFPAIYYDSGKLVLLGSDNAEDRSNIASSGIDGTQDVQYFSGAKRVYYVKNNDLYTYSLKNNESMRIIRNISDFACFDDGKKAVASAQDGKIYYFNGKEVSSIAKDNDEAGLTARFPFVFGDGSDDALFIDKYDSASSSAEIYRISGNGKPKLVAEIQSGASDIKYFNGSYLLIGYASGNAEIYNTDGKTLLELEDYNSSVAIATENILISHKDGSLGIFDGDAETILDVDVEDVIAVSDHENSFAYYDIGKIACLYKEGKIIEICDATYYNYLTVDMDTYEVFALEDDVLTGFSLKSNKYKEHELGDGVESIQKDKITGQWTAYGFDTVYQIDNNKLVELYNGSKQMPIISSDGKKALVLSEDNELILISKGDEKIIAEDVQTFYCDAKCKNILLVTDDKLYCNSDENKITNLRDASTFEIIYPMD